MKEGTILLCLALEAQSSESKGCERGDFEQMIEATSNRLAWPKALLIKLELKLPRMWVGSSFTGGGETQTRCPVASCIVRGWDKKALRFLPNSAVL